MANIGMVWNRVRRHKILSGALVFLTIIAIAVVAGRLWIKSDSGRNYILSQLNGRDIAGYGTLSAEGLSGDPFESIQIRVLKIADAEGAWLEIDSAEIEWRPLKLLNKSVALEFVAAKEIRVLRRPTRAPRPETASSAPRYTFTLDTLQIERLFLAEGVAGDAAAFSINGDLSQDAYGALVGQADIVPLEGRGDRLSLSASIPRKGAYLANAKIDAPAGGVIATLLKLPEGSAAGVEADVSLDGGVGALKAVLDIDGAQAATLEGALKNDVFSLDAEAEMARLPVPAQVKTAADGLSTLRVTGTLDELLADFVAVIDVGPGRVDLNGVVDMKTRKLTGPLLVKSERLGLRTIGNLDATLDLDGSVARSGKTLSYEGRVGLERMTEEALPFALIEGPVDVAFTDGVVLANVDMVATEAFTSSEQFAKVVGKSLGVTGTVSYTRDTDVVTLKDVALKLADGRATANGDLNLSSKALKISGPLDQSIGLLSPDFEGRIGGTYTVSGSIDQPVLNTRINAKGLSGLPGAVGELIGTSPKLDSTVTYGDGVLNIRKANLLADGIEASLTGRIGREFGANIGIRARQRGALTASETEVLLGDFDLILSGPVGALEVDLSSINGTVKRGDRVAKAVAIKAKLVQSGDGWSGPVDVAADLAEGPLSIVSTLTTKAGGIVLDDIIGELADIDFGGRVSRGVASELSAELTASSDALTWEGGSLKRLDVDLSASQTADQKLALTAQVNAKGIALASGLVMESLDVTAKGADGAFDYTGNAVGTFGVHPFDTEATGTIDVTENAPAGQIILSGHVFGQLIKSNRPLKWKLGERPEIDVDLLLLGGELDLRLTDAGDRTALTYTARELEIGPLLTPLGLSAAETRVSGTGDVRPYGAKPKGTFTLSARSPVSGLDSALDFDIAGDVSARGVDVTGRTQFGTDLTALIKATLPLDVKPAQVASVNMDAPLRGTVSFKGDLASARQAALAFGHDVSGLIDANGKIAGSLSKPDISGTAQLENGVYEFGATGMRIRDLSIDARYGKSDFALIATGKSAEGGTVALNGRIMESGPAVDVQLNRFLAFDQRGDTAIVSGLMTLDLGEKTRGVNGKLNIDRAQFSLENLPQSGPRAIDVRWSDAPTAKDNAKEPVPFLLDVTIKADRQVFLKGRGFDGEWGADVRLAGTANKPEIYGAATLIRGQIDLAGRPLVFDVGKILFDGNMQRTRLEISAERTANDLTTRVALAGQLAKPDIELSSTPDLPQDEILSRLLFSRASIDLTAFEAAQLAGTFRRLRGDAFFFNPAEELQAVLGVDRLSFGATDEGVPQIGVGQYLADNVYLQINTAGVAGTSAEVEWQPIPQIAVTSETKADGEGRVSLRWKKDY